MLDPVLLRDLRRFSGQEEAALYLDWIGDLLGGLGLQSGDPRFHFNPTGRAKYALALTINHRYVTCQGRSPGGETGWWLIHPGLPLTESWEEKAFLHRWSFAQKRQDVDGCPAGMALYPVPFVQAHRERLFERTLALARRELEACRGATPSRLSHHALAYTLAVDDRSRQDWLRPALWSARSRR